jgi:hypothetical protein
VTAPVSAPALVRRGGRTAPLSAAQHGIWVAQLSDPEAATYHVPLLIECGRRLDGAALRTALTALTARHEILRTRYEAHDGNPVQVVGDPEPVTVRTHSCAALDPAAVRDAAGESAARPFALDTEPPLRCDVWTDRPGGDLLLLCLHHIAIDGWSVPLLITQLWAQYDAALAGEPPELPESPVQYADFAAWEDAHHRTAEHARLVAARADRLRDVAPRLRLGRPEAVLPAPGATGRGGHLSVPLEPRLAADLAAVAARLRATPYVVLLAAFAETVRRWSGEPRFTLATALVNRPDAALEEVIGCFVTTAPIRCEVRAHRTFAELCRDVRDEFTDLLRHQTVPAEHLAALLPGAALTQVGFIVLHTPVRQAGGRMTPISSMVLPTGTAKSDLTLLVEPGERMTATVEFDTARYDRGTVERIVHGFVTLLSAALEEPGVPVARLPGATPVVLTGPADDLLRDHLHRMTERTPA